VYVYSTQGLAMKLHLRSDSVSDVCLPPRTHPIKCQWTSCRSRPIFALTMITGNRFADETYLKFVYPAACMQQLPKYRPNIRRRTLANGTHIFTNQVYIKM
jgi:hypothetical protein